MAVTVFLGGARSGKSRLAQRAAEVSSGPLTYIATAEPRDAEMADRIARHRADRGRRWITLERPIDLADAIGSLEAGAAVIDCLTLWLTNVMLADLDVSAATDTLVAAIERSPVPLFIVSNEVGGGIVPETPLGRAFRDEAGRLNQAVAAAADVVLFVVAGLVLPLKRVEPL